MPVWSKKKKDASRKYVVENWLNSHIHFHWIVRYKLRRCSFISFNFAGVSIFQSNHWQFSNKNTLDLWGSNLFMVCTIFYDYYFNIHMSHSIRLLLADGEMYCCGPSLPFVTLSTFCTIQWKERKKKKFLPTCAICIDITATILYTRSLIYWPIDRLNINLSFENASIFPKWTHFGCRFSSIVGMLVFVNGREWMSEWKEGQVIAYMQYKYDMH